jgi:pimeloyl-[acyl-carrier protein] methyl ester esterase
MGRGAIGGAATNRGAIDGPRRMTGLHVQVAGDGPPLVLLHGWAMHGGVFASLVERLRERHTLYVVDLPGHGLSRDSAVPLELDATVDAILAQVPDASWCAWSLGGLFALHAALREPARIPALIMICASPRFVRGEGLSGQNASGQSASSERAADGNAADAPWRYGVSPEIFQSFATGLREDYRATLERFVALEAFGSDHARDAVRALRNELFARGEPPAQVLARGLELLETTDLRAALPRLRVPSLWIAGRRDRLVDPRAMREAAALAPRSRFVQIEHGGHAPFLTDTEEVAAAIEAVLAKAPDRHDRHPRESGDASA